MQIKVNSLDELDESVRDNFVAWKDGDKEIFVHKDLAESLKEQFRLKGDLTDVKGKFDGIQSKLTELTRAEEERKRLEEEAELEAKRKNGQHDEIIADWERKHAEAQDTIAQLKQQRLDDKKETIVTELATAGTDDTRDMLKRLINQDLTHDENGELIVLDSAGKATSKTLEEYKAGLKDLYPALVAGVQSNGGNANGGFNSGAGSKKPSEYTEAERVELFRTNPERFKQLFQNH